MYRKDRKDVMKMMKPMMKVINVEYRKGKVE